VEAIDPASLAVAKEYVQIGIEKGGSAPNEGSVPFDFVFADMNGCVISGAPGSGKTNLLGRIVRGLLEDKETAVYLYEKDSKIQTQGGGARSAATQSSLAPLNPPLESLRGGGGLTAAHGGAALDAMVSQLLEEYYRRVGGGDAEPPRAALCIDDFAAAFGDISDGKVDALTTLILYGGDFGIYTYITVDAAGLAKFRDLRVEPFIRCLEKDRAVAVGGRSAGHEAQILRGGETRRVKLAEFPLGDAEGKEREKEQEKERENA
jgi:hypothetical protein